VARPAAKEDVFRAIADPTRRRLLDLLREGEKPVGTMADRFELTLAAISQHLRVLREVGLVTERRDGRQRLYSIEPGPLREVVDWIAEYERFWTHKMDALDTYLKKRNDK
jgi:DNA-binding transcriptional ArsR family regulator